MITAFTTPAYLLLVGTLFYAIMAVVLVRYRRVPGAPVTAFAMGACLVFVLGALFSTMATDPAQQLLALNFGYVGSSITPAAIFAFAAYYTRAEPLAWRTTGRLLIVPAVSIILVWTNSSHELMWAHPPVSETGEFTVRADWGPWFLMVHLPYQWLLVLFTQFYLLRAAVQGVPSRMVAGPRISRGQAATLFVALTATFLVNVYTVAGPEDFPTSPTAIAVALSSVCFLWVFGQIELVPFRHVAHRRILSTMPDPVFIMDERDQVLDLNPRAEALLGRDDAVGRPLTELFEVEPDLLGLLRNEGDAVAELSFGSGKHYEAHLTGVVDAGGNHRGRTLLLRDITDRFMNDRRMHSIVDVSPNGIVRARAIVNPEGTIEDVECTFANVAAATFIGVDHAHMAGATMLEQMPAVGPQMLGVFQRAMDSGEDQRVDIPVAGEAEDPLWYRAIVSPVDEELTITFMDVTEEKRREAEMHEVAFLDPLTHVLNRRGLERALEEVARPGRRVTDEHAVLYLDLDRFKEVNDSYGHTVGDRLLKEFAARLDSATRDNDIIARVGGDEFVLVLLECGHDTAMATVERLLQVTDAPYWLSESTVTCRASIGIAHTSDEVPSLSEALVEADRAMYLAKAAGGGARSA